MDGQLYKIDDNILKRFIIDGNDTYETTVVPRSLIPQVLQMVHDELGHNGTHRTYILLKRLYYWKRLKPSVEKHVKRSIWKVLYETELNLSSKLTSFCSQTWLLLLVCMGKCLPYDIQRKIVLYNFFGNFHHNGICCSKML